MRLRLSPKRQRANAGDTIVEVLIVLAIVGSALSISYATASRSLLGVEQSEEHAQALQLVQGQLEDLYATARADAQTGADTSALTPANGDIICFDGTTATDYPSTSDTTYLGPTDTACANIDSDGPSYDLSTTYDPSSSTYTAQASWNDINGQGQDTVSLLYKFYVSP